MSARPTKQHHAQRQQRDGAPPTADAVEQQHRPSERHAREKRPALIGVDSVDELAAVACDARDRLGEPALLARASGAGL
ncbi:MAG: hypothetical protein ACR2H2_13630 [Solirubrobacteraceae bacterium]